MYGDMRGVNFDEMCSQFMMFRTIMHFLDYNIQDKTISSSIHGSILTLLYVFFYKH